MTDYIVVLIIIFRRILFILVNNRSIFIQRNVWVQSRSKDWWNFVAHDIADSNWWHNNLCMSKKNIYIPLYSVVTMLTETKYAYVRMYSSRAKSSTNFVEACYQC